ncbi:MAG: hypothetical protein RLZZ127_1646 [Planctomycetota bacterium]|jgi:hypothetical protein
MIRLTATAVAALTLAGCTGDRPVASAPATPGRHVEEGQKFYAEILREHKGRKSIYLFSSKDSLEEFEKSGEVPPPVKSYVGSGPEIDGRKVTVVLAMANAKNLNGGADEAATKDRRVISTFEARYPGIDVDGK